MSDYDPGSGTLAETNGEHMEIRRYVSLTADEIERRAMVARVLDEPFWLRAQSEAYWTLVYQIRGGVTYCVTGYYQAYCPEPAR